MKAFEVEIRTRRGQKQTALVSETVREELMRDLTEGLRTTSGTGVFFRDIAANFVFVNMDDVSFFSIYAKPKDAIAPPV